jgi:hypothetical protein
MSDQWHPHERLADVESRRIDEGVAQVCASLRIWLRHAEPSAEDVKLILADILARIREAAKC